MRALFSLFCALCVMQVDTDDMRTKLAPTYGVSEDKLTITVSAGSAVLDITIKAAADDPQAASVLNVASVDTSSLGTALGVTVQISKPAETTVVSTIRTSSQAAATALVGKLSEVLNDPATASAALGVNVESVSTPDVRAKVVVVKEEGSAASGNVAGLVVSVLMGMLVCGVLFYRRRFGRWPGRRQHRAKTTNAAESEPPEAAPAPQVSLERSQHGPVDVSVVALDRSEHGGGELLTTLSSATAAASAAAITAAAATQARWQGLEA